MPDSSEPITTDRWVNRRRMAWLALIAGLLYPMLFLLTNNQQLDNIAGPFYMFVSAVVGAYIGFATIDDKWRNYPPQPDTASSVPPRIPVRLPEKE